MYERILTFWCDSVNERILLYVVPRINSEDLIDAQEVAELLGLSQRNAVSLYQRRYPDMPRPVVIRSGGKTRLWLESEITKWARKTDRVS